jgi:thiol:disulfide interchange protein DsbC
VKRTQRLAALAVSLAAMAQAGTGTTPAPSASAPDLSAPLEARIRAALKERVPGLTVSELHGSPLPGIYEILSPEGIAYTDETAEHLIRGQILDTRTHRNLSVERWNVLNSIDFASLPVSKAIKTVHGQGTREIGVFADPLCPYCKELESELAKLEDVTVYTFLYPLEDVHPGATQRAHELWCAADRTSAWSDWMLQAEAPPSSVATCPGDPVAELAALGAKLRINTTPTIFFRSGRRSAGLPPPEEFERLLRTESVAPAAAQAVDAGAHGS